MSVDPIRPLAVEQEIHPEGAYEDAARFRHAAERIQQSIQILLDEMRRLEQALEDAPQKKILEELAPILRKLETLAATLEIHAASIETKTITVQKTIWVGTHQVRPSASTPNPDLPQAQEGYDPHPP
jgi:hypothetical protein